MIVMTVERTPMEGTVTMTTLTGDGPAVLHNVSSERAATSPAPTNPPYRQEPA